MRIAPPRGMNDYLPDELALRDYMQGVILDTYSEFGFRRIATPVLEDADNLKGSEGGENLSLIYQVMKRGAKLETAVAEGEPLWDLGLRYDLTLPMVRFYAAHKDKLPSLFKCIQIGRAYRAERPQRGRLREFVQCDIDIVGSSHENAEIELVAVTARALTRLDFYRFIVRMNDRNLLNAFLFELGVPREQWMGACMALDKLDKVGVPGVVGEWIERGLIEAAAQLKDFLEAGDFSLERVRAIVGERPEIERMLRMIDQLTKISEGQWQVEYDLSLVRGQSYYTGTVFEVKYPGYDGSIAAGGRYDDLVGKFMKHPVPAVGFSIGFERIVDILLGNGVLPPQLRPRMALLYESGTPFAEVYREMSCLQAGYLVTALPRYEKTGKQLAALQREGYDIAKPMGQEIIQLKG